VVEKEVFQLDMEKSGLLSNKDHVYLSKPEDDDRSGTRNTLVLRYPPMNIPDNTKMIEVNKK